MYFRGGGIFKNLKNKVGASFVVVILAVTISAVIIPSFVNWLLALKNETIYTQGELEKTSVAYSEYKGWLQTDWEDIEKKENTIEVSDSLIGDFAITTAFGEKQRIDSSEDEPQYQMPITISVNKKDSSEKPYTLSAKIISSKVGGDSFPVGTILAYSGDLSKIPKKWALCDGTNGTPNLTGRFLQGWGFDGFNTHNVGDLLSPGLPNITGLFTAVGDADDYREVANGAFYIARRWGGAKNSNPLDSAQDDLFGFDASRSSSIYSNSVTVQPRSFVVYYIMKISN